MDLAIREILRLNGEGANAVCSLTEAHWKVHGIMNWWHEQASGRLFFRGEHHSDWQPTASAARKGLKPDPTNLLRVTDGELLELRRFQVEAQTDRDLFAAVFPDGRLLSLDSADWWCLMQHYKGGTRLVDVTSSVFCALFFACADWDGTIDEGSDGGFYLFPTEQWRGAVVRPDVIRGRNVGSTDQAQPTALEYFSVENHDQTVRFRESTYRNDRLLSQDGYFLWQPRFDQPLAVGQHFKLRVPAARKAPLLKELYSIGYTARRLVRGRKGEEAHRRICEKLNT